MHAWALDSVIPENKENMLNTQYAVYYACVIEDDEAGIFVDHPYFGGVVDSKANADFLERSIINDKHLPGAKFCKTYIYNPDKEMLTGLKRLASKQFGKMAAGMYAAEDMQARKKR